MTKSSVVILSKDRPAQLRLLLDSLEQNGGGFFDRPTVIGKGASDDIDAYRGAYFIRELDFERDVRDALELAGPFVCFMCDDGILYRRPSTRAERRLENPLVLCHSYRLGRNTVIQYPSGVENRYQVEHYASWYWQAALGDFGYPGSVDAHVFRTDELRAMLEPFTFPNPTALECALVEACFAAAQRRPKMSCDLWSSYVGNPVNRTSEQSGVRFGDRYPATVEECLERWQRGERIDFGRLDFSHVDGAHAEIELRWTADDRRAALHL